MEIDTDFEIGFITVQGSYTFSVVKFKDFSRTFKDHIFKFQGPYLLLLTQVPNKLQKYSDNNGPFSLMATIFYENSFVIA